MKKPIKIDVKRNDGSISMRFTLTDGSFAEFTKDANGKLVRFEIYDFKNERYIWTDSEQVKYDIEQEKLKKTNETKR